MCRSIAAMLFIIEQWLSCIDTIKRLLIQPFFLSHSHSRRCRTLLFQMKKKTVFIAPWADHTLSSVSSECAHHTLEEEELCSGICMSDNNRYIWQCRTATVCWLIDCALCQLRTSPHWLSHRKTLHFFLTSLSCWLIKFTHFLISH